MTVHSLTVVRSPGDKALYPSSSGEIAAGTLMSHRFPQLYLSGAHEYLHIPSTHRAHSHLKHKEETNLPVCVKLSTELPENQRLCQTSNINWGSGQPQAYSAGLQDTSEVWDPPGDSSSEKRLNDLHPPVYIFKSWIKKCSSRWQWNHSVQHLRKLENNEKLGFSVYGGVCPLGKHFESWSP